MIYPELTIVLHLDLYLLPIVSALKIQIKKIKIEIYLNK